MYPTRILVGLLGGEPLRKSILFIWGVSLGEEILSDLFREYSQSVTNAYARQRNKGPQWAARVGWYGGGNVCVRFFHKQCLRKIVCGTPEGVPGCLETAFLRPVTSWLHKRKQNK